MEDGTSGDSSDLKARELELERYKATLDFRKAIIISGFVAVAIALIPPLFQLASAAVEYIKFEHQLKIDDQNKNSDREAKEQNFRSEYVSAFLEKALNQDIELRLRLAEYFKYVAQGDEFRNGWENYYNRLKTTRNNIREEIENMEGKLSQIQKLSPPQRDYVEEDKLIQHLGWLRAEVGYVAPDKSVIRDPRVAVQPTTANAAISLEGLDAHKRDMAQKIITSFAKAGFGTYQQAAALADAILESDLNPSMTSLDGVGLFNLSQHGLGKSYTPAELQTTDINVGLIVAEAKKSSPFVNAASLEDAVDTFVRLIVRPVQPDSAALKVREIARRLIGTS